MFEQIKQQNSINIIFVMRLEVKYTKKQIFYPSKTSQGPLGRHLYHQIKFTTDMENISHNKDQLIWIVLRL